MTVTTDGRIVAAAGSGDKAGAYVFSPDGKLLEVIPTPEDPANVEFGGDDGKTLYICAGRSLYRIKTTMTGFRLWPPVEVSWRWSRSIGIDSIEPSVLESSPESSPG